MDGQTRQTPSHRQPSFDLNSTQENAGTKNCLRQSNDSLVRSEPLSQRCHGPQLSGTRHHNTDECAAGEAVASAERKYLGVSGVCLRFNREPKGEQRYGGGKGDEGDGVEPTKAVSEISWQDAAKDRSGAAELKGYL